jgi:uncharacterized membrane protein
MFTPLTENSRLHVYRHHNTGFYTILFGILFLILIFLFIGVTEAVFQQIGFSKLELTLILIGTMLGSFVNIPIYRISKRRRIVEYEEIRAFWVTYRIPRIGLRETHTTIAVNLGGAIIPVLVSVYLILIHFNILAQIFAGVVITSIIVHLVARRVEGVGIVTPAFIPPLAAAIVALLLSASEPAIVAYVSGSLGALIGADLTNLKGIGKMGETVASIGGAGTFDGIFLTGVIAVLIVVILHVP